jgi:predicted AAA+ superfamily ATPase
MMAQRWPMHVGNPAPAPVNGYFTETFAALDPRRTIEAIEFELNTDIAPRASILFFDEAQACPSVLPLLRYFHEETPDYRVIVTGSLLEFALAEPEFSIPVGRIELHHLGPLTFEEFLRALGEDKALTKVETFHHGDDLTSSAHEKLNELARTYSVVGGMPEAVAAYAKTRSLRTVEKVKAGIIDTFRLDFHKYRGRTDPVLLARVFDALPRLMGRKLIYSHVDPHTRSGDLARAVEQLRLARLIAKVHNTRANGIPLAAERDDRFFKILGLDTGLLLTQLQVAPPDVARAAELNLVNRGALAEQFVGQHLYALAPAYRDPELHYWAREARSASAEVDFVIADARRRIVPIEVKAGGTGKLRSLQIMTHEKSLTVAVRFCSDRPTVFRERRKTVKGDVAFTLFSLPHYLVQQIDRLLVE